MHILQSRLRVKNARFRERPFRVPPPAPSRARAEFPAPREGCQSFGTNCHVFHSGSAAFRKSREQRTREPFVPRHCSMPRHSLGRNAKLARAPWSLAAACVPSVRRTKAVSRCAGFAPIDPSATLAAFHSIRPSGPCAAFPSPRLHPVHHRRSFPSFQGARGRNDGAPSSQAEDRLFHPSIAAPNLTTPIGKVFHFFLSQYSRALPHWGHF